MTSKCDSPVVWGAYGNEKGYWQHQLKVAGISYSKLDSLETLKRKWQERPSTAKYECPRDMSPSKTGVGLKKGTPYGYDPKTGKYKRAGMGGVYTAPLR